jgi:hypothetical protein
MNLSKIKSMDEQGIFTVAMREVMAEPSGRLTMMYLISKMGYFSLVENEQERVLRNAACNMLVDIQERTGFDIAVDFGKISNGMVGS